MFLRRVAGVAILCVFPVLVATAQAASDLFGPWTRASNTPIITPEHDSSFTDPISGKPVHWEALHTFNPAAIVRNGKIYVLYRAEDDSGEMAIGGHVSRLGLAVSDDGGHAESHIESVSALRFATPSYSTKQFVNYDPSGSLHARR